MKLIEVWAKLSQSLSSHYITHHSFIIIQAGADLNAANYELDRPLHLAAGVGNLEVLRVLLDTGASLEARGWLENTALHVAAQAAQVREMGIRGLM